jgi:glutamate/aspartate transport system permease protein
MFKNYLWDWGVFLEPVATGEPTNYLGWLLAGLNNTVILALSASVLAMIVGVAMGVLRFQKCAADRAAIHLVFRFT